MLTPPAVNQPEVLSDPTLSSYREQLVEYAFVSELLQDGWIRRRQRIDVLRADVDGAGYDVVIDCQGVIRHVQLKSTMIGGLARAQNINSALAAQPSGCVVWVVLQASDEHRVRLSYLVFGSNAGSPLPALANYRVAKHAKANAKGIKTLRPAIRVVPRRDFVALEDVAELSDWLFGPATNHAVRRAAGTRD